ncbi:MAG: hypothetical protein ACRD4G_00595 [Bryobacteraceae bacterium]
MPKIIEKHPDPKQRSPDPSASQTAGSASCGIASPAVWPVERFQVPFHAGPVTGSHPDLPQDKTRLPPPLALGTLACCGSGG